MLLTSPNTVLLNAGDELHLKYGQRSNTELFVEYGFVNELVDHGSDFPAEISLDVDIQCVIEPMIRGLGVARAQRMKELLKDEGYEGDWTIHLQPSPAHPSYRVTTCLRLYALFAEHGPDTILDTQAVKLWKDTLAGRRPCISQRNEVAWRTVLRELCTGLIGEAQTASQQTLTTKEGWERWAWRCVRALGAEMGMVARAVGESVDAGEEF
ncbi:hypothetical protein BDV98DRAFT_557791 [Pterulicium gracile]|uniref:SET domain-containing protein n=1 Tax=Pterulicium gracile TaxID=1884261 RepID=A0A5C3R3R3_9AGAR|nr:hypothetical protein BDV98DRAFT_557791 [Pterula gracilis]